jgi:hypothetical protein
MIKHSRNEGNIWSFENTSQKKPLIPNTEDTKDKKIKFQKNLILRTYVALNVHYCLLQQYHQKLTRTRDMISARTTTWFGSLIPF